MVFYDHLFVICDSNWLDLPKARTNNKIIGAIDTINIMCKHNRTIVRTFNCNTINKRKTGALVHQTHIIQIHTTLLPIQSLMISSNVTAFFPSQMPQTEQTKISNWTWFKWKLMSIMRHIKQKCEKKNVYHLRKLEMEL